LQFDLATIEAATNHFSDDNKLGEGGFGAVYKVNYWVFFFFFKKKKGSIAHLVMQNLAMLKL
jgi:hypothetical protein